MANSFTWGDKQYSADAIAAIAQKGFDIVEVRYSDGKPPVLLTGATTSAIMLMVSKAKDTRR